MKKIFKATIIMNDGTKTGIMPASSEEQARARIEEGLNTTTRFFKHNGVDYGPQGKRISFSEQHGGLKEAIITVYEEKETIKY